MECTKVNCPMQAGTKTDNCGENCPWRTTAKTGDLISREAAKAAIRGKFQSVADRCEINEVLNELPAVDAVPVEWLVKQFNDNPGSLWAKMCRMVYTGWEKTQNPLWEER